MDLTILITAIVLGYLLGSISFTRLIGRYLLPEEDLITYEVDVPYSESKFVLSSVSATSISIRKGSRWGMLTGFLDRAKAALPLVF